jgi:hypothetical protein
MFKLGMCEYLAENGMTPSDLDSVIVKKAMDPATMAKIFGSFKAIGKGTLGLGKGLLEAGKWTFILPTMASVPAGIMIGRSLAPSKEDNKALIDEVKNNEYREALIKAYKRDRAARAGEKPYI